MLLLTLTYFQYLGAAGILKMSLSKITEKARKEQPLSPRDAEASGKKRGGGCQSTCHMVNSSQPKIV